MAFKDDLVFSHITERDIDLLLVEELKCSDSFATWFLARIFDAEDTDAVHGFRFASVRHSVKGIGKALGESDLEALFERTAANRVERLLVLIENKIDAVFQPDQPVRYRLRADAAVAAIQCEKYMSVLIAPRSYLDSAAESPDFHRSIGYEDIMAHFIERATAGPSELARRFQHRAHVIECAIERFRRGWTSVPDACTTAIWACYYDMVQRVAPELGMERPGAKPVASTFVIFGPLPPDLRLPRCRLKHKLAHGVVDLEIAGQADRLVDLEPRLAPMIASDMIIRAAGKSLAIGLAVPRIDMAASADSQVNQFEAGIRAAVRLRTWFEQNAARLGDACSLVD